MFTLRYILPVAAVLRSAVAAGACSGTTTIQNSGDAAGIAACGTYSGSITVATQAADEVRIDTLQEIDGDLNVVSADDLSAIGADTLDTITGTFKLSGVRQLTSIDMPKLDTVGGLDFSTLPALNGLGFTSGITTAKTIVVRDTQLQDLTGIDIEEVDSLTVQSNGILSNVSLPLTKINSVFILSENGQSLGLSLPKLKEAKTLTIQGCSDIDISALETVGGALDVESGSFEVLEAEKLTEVDSTLTIQKNPALKQIKLPALETCGGGFVIAENDNLKTIDGLDKLETIDGNLDFTGDFTEVDLPKLNSVKGAFNMQSKGDINAVCNAFNGKHGQNEPIRGKYTCTPKAKNPTSIGGGDGNSSTDDEGDLGVCLSSPTGAVMMVAGGLAVFGLL